MGIFHLLRSTKEPGLVKELNQCLKFTIRLAEAKETAEFIKECIQSNTYPKEYWKVLRRHHIEPNNRSLKRHSLNQLDTYRNRITQFERNIAQRECAMELLSEEEKVMFQSMLNQVVIKCAQNKRLKLQRGVSKSKPVSHFPDQPEKCVHNFSDMNLDRVTLEILSLGPQFCCPRRRTNKLEVDVQFENLYNQTTDLTSVSSEDLNILKSTLVNCAQRYHKEKQKHRSILTSEHLQKLKELRQNPELLITRPDKGAGIVLMKRKDYLEKMNAILADGSKFREDTGKKDRTELIEQQMMKPLKSLKEAEALAIQTLDPPLCNQKQFVRALALPWPRMKKSTPPPGGAPTN
ncbi:unnamed protein product [Echinostoma caproni]|uniref:Coiled-coil domain containing 113 n=1 Tax=Echinostoma caproni TaxID=27848 RepID=A0A183BG89_9TREM|nr:unnamed protein product [Echinostoma caproni]